jgi:peptidoglycan/xylan/chitin deacetylase (PgdA/CDA1 family)
MKNITVTTSWDDGHVLDIKLANLLKKYGLKGTFYISAENREFKKKELLTNRQIISLSRDFEIGAHTMTHPRLSKVGKKESEAEIAESKIYLEKLTGKKIISFCYPGGDYNHTHISQLKKAGYKMARTTKRFSTGTAKNPYETPTTIHAYRHWSDVIQIAKVANYNPIKFTNYYLNWDKLAIALFDQVLKHGGIFHLWGHSWEINKNKDWERLENVFRYLANRKDVRYAVNGELNEK